MICPKCGYLMDSFDKECPRCQGKSLSPSASPTPATQLPRHSGVSLPQAAPQTTFAPTHQQVSVDQSHMNPIYTMKGVQDTLEVFEDRVTITPKGVLGFLNKGIKGTKEIPFHSIVAVQFKEAGAVFSGYIQFTIPGGNESKGGLMAATKDENTFMFAEKKNNALALEIKTYIDAAVRKLKAPQASPPPANLSDELQKLAALKAQGILSDDEFQAAKKRLIG